MYIGYWCLPAFVALVMLSPATVRACPEALLGTDTSTATLIGMEYEERDGLYLLSLDLEILDAPETRTIATDQGSVEARVEHKTPLSLASWTENVTVLFGGGSKFVVGAVYDAAGGDVAVVPYASIKAVSVSQGDDFDEDAPFQVHLELALLHRPTPFDGERQAFEPLEGAVDLGGWYATALPNPDSTVFDPYGQAYGDYFARRAYVFSFIHGPRAPGEFVSADDPMPTERAVAWTAQHGFVAFSRMAGSPPGPMPGSYPGRTSVSEGDLYGMVTDVYRAIGPTVLLDEMVGRQIQFALTGDRALDPPLSPYTDFHPVCTFASGRFPPPEVKRGGLVKWLGGRPAGVAVADENLWQAPGGAVSLRGGTSRLFLYGGILVLLVLATGGALLVRARRRSGRSR